MTNSCYSPEIIENHTIFMLPQTKFILRFSFIFFMPVDTRRNQNMRENIFKFFNTWTIKIMINIRIKKMVKDNQIIQTKFLFFFFFSQQCSAVHRLEKCTYRFTCNTWLASNVVPGLKTIGWDTWPESTHNILGYSSFPKSPICRAFSQGFQITEKKITNIKNEF